MRTCASRPGPRRLGCFLPLAGMLAVTLPGVLLLAGCRYEPETAAETVASVPPPAPAPPPPATEVAEADALLPLDLESGSYSVSGISSGGYMAQQLHVVHADRFVGAGVVAAGPYGCAAGSLGLAMARCMAAVNQPLDVGELAAGVREAAAAGRIADPAHLAGDRVWLFRGTLDEQIGADVAAAAHAFYLEFVAPENVVYVNDVAAAHHFPTTGGEGHPCDRSESPFLGACDFDAAGAILEHIYGPLEPPAGSPGSELAQMAFLEPDNDAGLMERAYLYVPAACERGATRCRLHLVLHGCLQSAEKVGTAFAAGAGYNGWADANALVVVYPQVRSSAANPYGCWDWWGYTGVAHATRNGPQIRALMSLIEGLTRKPG